MSTAMMILRATLILLLCTTSAFALDPNKMMRQFAHRSWGAADGLDKVYAIAQTKDGYIWIGTAVGLFQFDGTRFTRWQPAPGEPGVRGTVTSLRGSSDGSLWICANAEIVQFKDGHSRRVFAEDGSVLISNHIRETSDGTIWFAGRGLAKFANGRLEPVNVAEAPPDTQFRGPAEDRDHTIWISLAEKGDSSSDGQTAFLRAGEEQFHVVSERHPISFDIQAGPDGKIWAAQTRRSVRAFVREGAGIQFLTPEIRVGSQSILFDRDGALWITTMGDGLRRIKNPGALGLDDIEQFSGKADILGQKDGLSSDVSLCIFEDREGNIWVGTSNGLDCFRENKISAFSVREGLPFDQNLVLGRDSAGSIWAGSVPRGFLQLPKGASAFIDRKWLDLRYELPDGKPITHRLHCLYQADDGRLLAATGGGLIVIKPDGSGEYLKLPDGLSLSKTSAITGDRDGGLWLCDTEKGVHRVLGDKVERFPQIVNEVLAAHGDSSGRVWLGLRRGGVAAYEVGQFHFYNAKDGLFPGEIRAITSDSNGHILFAGQGGISLFARGRFQTLNRHNGLPEDDLMAVLQDDDGNFWFAGMGAIFRIMGESLEKAFASASDTIAVDNFDLNDGLRGFVRQAAFGYPGVGFPLAAKGSDGRLWFSTSGGLAAIHPHHIPRNTVPPPVHIQKVVADGKTYNRLNWLELPIGTKRCEISYVGLSFADPAKVRYRYRLEGQDDGWVEAGSRNQAVYSNLRPKPYRFQVMASNNDGVWNETGATLSFAILPAFYQTPWFFTLCLFALVALLWALHRIRLARLAAHLKLQFDIQQKERKRIAQELHDTLLQGFTGIGLRLDAIANSLPAELANTREQLHDILDQSDHYLTDARRAVWELRSNSLEVPDDFVTALAKAGKRILQGSDLDFGFSVSGSPYKLAPLVEDNLLRICDEAMSNAVKHAQATRMEVKVGFGDREVRLEIRDDGRGFDPGGPERAKAGHFGLVGIQERVKIMNGRLNLNSQPGAGTAVIVTVPA